ncbi:MAG: hypothetical protein ACE5JU_09920 [Candidatus Binatia bacterium]
MEKNLQTTVSDLYRLIGEKEVTIIALRQQNNALAEEIVQLNALIEEASSRGEKKHA